MLSDVCAFQPASDVGKDRSMLPFPEVRSIINDTARKCVVTYQANYLSLKEADALFAAMEAETPFREESPVVFGRAVPVRRASCAYGAPGRRYRYSGVERVAIPWPTWMLSLVEKLEKTTSTAFDFVLCNRYPDGASGLGWHADDEDDLVPNASIASISLGAERDFALRVGNTGSACATVTLGHGSLLVMAGATQRHYQHRVPPRLRVKEPRINLTFRKMKTDS